MADARKMDRSVVQSGAIGALSGPALGAVVGIALKHWFSLELTVTEAAEVGAFVLGLISSVISVVHAMLAHLLPGDPVLANASYEDRLRDVERQLREALADKKTPLAPEAIEKLQTDKTILEQRVAETVGGSPTDKT